MVVRKVADWSLNRSSPDNFPTHPNSTAARDGTLADRGRGNQLPTLDCAVGSNAGGEETRALIVEDEPLVAMLLVDLVEDAGFVPVGRAGSACEALQLADAERPTIAILDVNLRGPREGLQVGAELARQGIALIFISGHFDVHEWSEVRDLAPVSVLQKPFPPAEIVNALRAAAGRGRVSRPKAS